MSSKKRTEELKEKAKQLSAIDPIAASLGQRRNKRSASDKAPDIISRNERQNLAEYKKLARQAPKDIPVSQIRVTPLANRDERFMERSAFEQLVASIQTHGQLVPIFVREIEPDGDYKYELIAGRRRLEACRKLNKPVKAVVMQAVDDAKLMELQFLENYREDLTIFETAETINKLLELRVYESQREMARMTGYSRTQIQRYLSLLNIPKSIRDNWLIEFKAPEAEGMPASMDVCPIVIAEKLSKIKYLDAFENEIIEVLLRHSDEYWAASWKQREKIITSIAALLNEGHDPDRAFLKKSGQPSCNLFTVTKNKKTYAKVKVDDTTTTITLNHALDGLDEQGAQMLIQALEQAVNKIQNKE